jgi:hypothetical protein
VTIGGAWEYGSKLSMGGITIRRVPCSISNHDFTKCIIDDTRTRGWRSALQTSMVADVQSTIKDRSGCNMISDYRCGCRSEGMKEKCRVYACKQKRQYYKEKTHVCIGRCPAGIRV